MSSVGRWTIAVVICIAALAVALVTTTFHREPRMSGFEDAPSARELRDADTPEALAGVRDQAQLAPCPAPGAGPGTAALAGISLQCAGDGKPVPVEASLAGRAVVLDLWAYWCGPCADELPAMAEVQRRAGNRLTVLTVHQDENEEAGLAKLAELSVRLPMLQDGARRIAAALKVPNVMPATILIRPDGTVARILPRPFTSADEIDAEIATALGVRY